MLTFHFTAVGAGVLSRILSPVSIGALFTGTGAGASITLAAISSVFGVGASSLAIISTKFGSKIEKHRDSSAIVAAKQETVNRLVSKALMNQKITESDFQLILNEMACCNELKQFAHNKYAKKSSPPNIDEIRKHISQEFCNEYQKSSQA